MWYVFRQNNSYGVYMGPSRVVVEANSADEANRAAEAQGVYFDGVARGLDCSCCGDRWDRAYSDAPDDY